MKPFATIAVHTDVKDRLDAYRRERLALLGGRGRLSYGDLILDLLDYVQEAEAAADRSPECGRVP